jgi:lipoyl(octanoyl) transferase
LSVISSSCCIKWFKPGQFGICLPALVYLQNKSIALDKLPVVYKDLGIIRYKAAWDYQEELLQYNVQLKSQAMQQHRQLAAAGQLPDVPLADTTSYLLLCEHPPVYTLGKSGNINNVLITEAAMQQQQIDFYKINRGGDITFHGPGQLVGYPILDLEKIYTDIGRYLRELEEVIILTIADYGIKGSRSQGETGVWIDPDIQGSERKICAMGVRCSRWITMHGFALNVNTDLSYFNNIVPCGIVNKQVTSIQKELGRAVDMQEVKEKFCHYFQQVFKVQL